MAVVEAGQPLDYLRRPAGLAASWRKLPEAGGYLAELARPGCRCCAAARSSPRTATAGCASVTVARIDAAWAVVPGTERALDADVLAAGYGFIPQVELLRRGRRAARRRPRPGRARRAGRADQQTTVPGLFAAGETTGVGGADLARIEGAAAGRAAGPRDAGPAAGRVSRRPRGRRARRGTARPRWAGSPP